jgi:predicted amidohydrolase
MAERTRIGAACMQPAFNKKENLQRIVECMRRASHEGVGLLVLPELILQGYPLGLGSPWANEVDDHEYQLRNAETIPGPATELLREAAKELRLEIVFGLTEAPTEPYSAGRLFNTAILLGPDGVMARYRKTHLGATEKDLWNRGHEWVIADTSAGKAGLLICHDLCFPEACRSLALAGAELLLMPTAWPPMPTDGYDLFTRSRALENQVYLVSANLTGGPKPGFWGHSRIVSPRGEVVAESEGEGLAIAEIDVEEGVIDSRTHGWFGVIFLKDRQPDVYSPLCKTR